MAIQIDASSPASATGNAAEAPITTDSFNPPANSLIVIITTADNSTTATGAASDSQGNSYTRHARSNSNGAVVEVYSYYTASALSNLTVTVTFTNAWYATDTGIVTVLVLTGAKSVQPGNVATNGTGSTIALTPTALNSYVVGGFVSINTSQTPAANANSTILRGVNGGGASFTLATWRSTNSTSALSSTTYGLSNTGLGGTNNAAVEILAAPEPTSPIAWMVA